MENRIKLSVNKQQDVLIKNGTIITMDPSIADLSGGDILIQHGKIQAIGKGLEQEHMEIIDASGMIVFPGFVDAHRHAWLGTLRSTMPNVNDLMTYVADIHFGFAKYYRPEDIYLGNLLTAISAIDSGITTIVDASHNARSLEHAYAAIDALTDSGIRALYAPAFPLGGEWDSSFWPRGVEQVIGDLFSSTGSLIKPAIFTHMSNHSWDLARALGVPVITEVVGQQMSDLLEVIAQNGQLGPDNIFNHCTGLTPRAWEIIRDAGVKVTVDPRSDAHYGLEEGVFAYQHAINHGIRPAIGTDLETAYGGDMFTEMRVAFTLQRAWAQHQKYKGEKAVPSPVLSRKILEAATINGADIAGFGHVSGSITPGKAADLVLLRATDINLFPSNNAIGSLVHAADRSNVDTVIVDGRILKRGGKLQLTDMQQLNSRINASLEYLFMKAGYSPDVFLEEFPRLSFNQ
ncbi:amidohydrolase family protein [Chitinophaga arvensicola]|uniref:Cytosine/adenosine deaminase n=1 Tax=Chitinophaga arvensicola TaxID=29529 RepID=A0A1I0SE27_9BACT|nr:amidohydrolase family protein [Chitinophaga arvensicola]SEW57480.1 Cytosine/adenosine deaminase [Chitinophaga arvensicola]